MNIVAYALPLNPEPWAIGPAFPIRSGKGGLTAKVGPNKTLQAYQNAVRDELMLQNCEVVPGEYSLRFTFSRQLASYQGVDGTSTRNGADATNMQKATEDALQGVLIGNDRDVVRVQSYRADQGSHVTNPFVVIELIYGIGEDDPSFFPINEMTDEGDLAFQQMQERVQQRAELKKTTNVWIP